MTANGRAGHRHQDRREYFWVLAISLESGRPIILGPYDNENEARQMGFAKIPDGNFEVYPLRTRNRVMARDLLKYKRFEKSAQLEETLKRAKYQV